MLSSEKREEEEATVTDNVNKMDDDDDDDDDDGLVVVIEKKKKTDGDGDDNSDGQQTTVAAAATTDDANNNNKRAATGEPVRPRKRHRLTEKRKQEIKRLCDQKYKFKLVMMGSNGECFVPLRWYHPMQLSDAIPALSVLSRGDNELSTYIAERNDEKVCELLSVEQLSLPIVETLVDYVLHHRIERRTEVEYIQQEAITMDNFAADPTCYMRRGHRFVLGVPLIELASLLGMGVRELMSMLIEFIDDNQLDKIIEPERLLPKCDPEACDGLNGIASPSAESSKLASAPPPSPPPPSRRRRRHASDDDDDVIMMAAAEEDVGEEKNVDDEQRKRRAKYMRHYRSRLPNVHVVPVYLLPYLVGTRFLRRYWRCNQNVPAYLTRSLFLQAHGYYKDLMEQSVFDVESVAHPASAQAVAYASRRSLSVNDQKAFTDHYKDTFAQLAYNSDKLDVTNTVQNLRARVSTLERLFEVMADHLFSSEVRANLVQACSETLRSTTTR